MLCENSVYWQHDLIEVHAVSFGVSMTSGSKWGT